MQVKSKLKTGRNLTSPVRFNALKIKRKTTSGSCFPMMSPASHTDWAWPSPHLALTQICVQ